MSSSVLVLPMEISGIAGLALNSLSRVQVNFLESIPKAELHAHLNGSIPLTTLKELASEYIATTSKTASPPPNCITNEAIKLRIEELAVGPILNEITEFFGLFPAIYALTSTPSALARATRAVLDAFLGGEVPQCQYLELRTTPRETESMSREEYLRVVLGEMKRAGYTRNQVSLIVSVDRRMDKEVIEDCVNAACQLRQEGQWVVAVDLCGDPTQGNVEVFEPYFERVKGAGLGLTLHIAETIHNTREENMKLLSYNPNRVGHATFLDDAAIEEVTDKKICVEICLSSNILGKTVSTLESHHIQQYLKANHPIAICTDDILPFKTSLVAEYALLIAKPPFGLGLTEDLVRVVGEMSMEARFK